MDDLDIIKDAESKDEEVIANQDLQDFEILKNGLVSSASHQLRTPLTTINWYSELLIDGDVGELNELQSDYVKQIYFSSKKMVRIVDSLINASIFENGHSNPEEIELEIIPFVNEVVNMIKKKTKRDDIVISAKKSADLVAKIVTDREMLRQVIAEVVENAITYSPNPDSTIEIELKDELDKLIIRVIDHGIGIPEDEQSHIFGKFFRASNASHVSQEGIGINLAISRLIMDVLGGEISFESQENRGSVFTIMVPIVIKKKTVADYTDLQIL